VSKSTNPGQMQNADRLLYHLFDKITAESMTVVDHLDEEMDELEQEVFNHSQRDQLPRLFRLRRIVLQLRRIFGSQREMMNRLARDTFSIIRPDSRVYFRDIYDHLIRMHELTDGLRDMASGALESHISVTSYRMNEVMKTLTVVTVLFMPITFLTGFFGMNFFGDQFNVDNPVHPRWLFTLIALVMATLPPVMLVWMARRGWLKSQYKPEPPPGQRSLKE
jgi:magnesium transporter